MPYALDDMTLVPGMGRPKMGQILFPLYGHCPKNYTFDNGFIKRKSAVCAWGFDRLIWRDHIVRVGMWVQPCRGIFRRHDDGEVALAIV